MSEETMKEKTAAPVPEKEEPARKRGPHAVFGIAIAVLLILLGLVHLLMPDRAYSPSEKRMLAQFPTFSFSSLADGTFTKGVEDWAADQFPGRDAFMVLRTRAAYFLGQRESNDVYYGKDGHLIERFDEPDEDRYTRTADAVSAFAARHPDARTVFLLVPTQAAMLTDLLPDGAPCADENAFIDRFLDKLSGTAETPDLRTVLSAAAEEGTELYYRSDHHWTTDAAYAAFRSVRQAMDLEEMPWERSVVTGSFAGTLSAKSGYRLPTGDEVAVYRSPEEPAYVVINQESGENTASLYHTEALAGDNAYEIFFGGNYPMLMIETSADTERTLLVFKDSYANCFLPFLIPHFCRIAIIDPRYYSETADLLFVTQEFSEVLFLYNAATLAEDTSLAKVLAPN